MGPISCSKGIINRWSYGNNLVPIHLSILLQPIASRFYRRLSGRCVHLAPRLVHHAKASKEPFYRWHEHFGGQLSSLQLLSKLDQERDHGLADGGTSFASAGKGGLGGEELNEREEVVIGNVVGYAVFEGFR